MNKILYQNCRTRCHEGHPHLMVLDLSLQFLYVTGRYWTVLNDAMSFFYQSLEIPDFLFILLILHHSLLGHGMNAEYNIRL